MTNQYLCSMCKVSKDAEDFPKRPNGKPHTYCRLCKREYDRGHYRKHQVRHRVAKNERGKARRARLRAKIDVIKGVPCADCQVQYSPWVMQFDHLRDKLFNIGNSMGMAESLLLNEIAKCEVVCANCHAERTHQRGMVQRNGRGVSKTLVVSSNLTYPTIGV